MDLQEVSANVSSPQATSNSTTEPTLGPTSTRSPQLSEDELTLHLVASGLMALAQQANSGQALSLPYPVSLQRGLDRLVVTSLLQRVAIPQSVPDLLDWCRRPLATWQLALLPEAIGPGERLLDRHLPTMACEAWACASSDVEAELTEKSLFASVYSTCRSADLPQAYVAFWLFLIENPVLTEFELHQHSLKPDLRLLTDQLHEVFEPAPLAHSQDGRFYCCPTCGSLLLRVAHGGQICEDERCRRKNSSRKGRTISTREGVLWLKRGPRRFIAAPGRAELRLARRLEKLELQVDLWPNYDAYDLRVTFPDEEAWAVDVKDWANPFLLARKAKPIPLEDCRKAFFVFPDERHQDRSDYLRAFENHTQVLNQRTDALFERGFIAAVKDKLREIT